jgi:D-alanyl-D-alanine carboxypeptidase
MLATMDDRRFLTARVDDDGGVVGPCEDAAVPWWSFTKTALATVALQLVAQGELVLDGAVDDRPYTLRQLLQHRAGVPDYGRLTSYHAAVRRGERPWEVEQLMDRVAVERLDFQPGKGWGYSNVGYLLVRRMVEKATGQDLGSAFRRFVFDPLNLSSVRLATSAKDLALTAWGNPTGYDPGWVYHGLLVGTPGDAVQFLHRLMSGEVLPRALLSEMTKCHPIGGPLVDRPWETTGYGLGLMMGKMSRAGFGIGHSGVGPSSVGAVYHFRDRASPCTVAAFAQGHDEGVCECEAARLAGA